MASGLSRTRIRPAKNEWGVYDPAQAGFAALYARLDAKDPKAATTPQPAPATMTEAKDAPRPKPSKG